MPFLIDGYNLLRAIQNKDEEFAPLTDVQLCEKLGAYLARTAENGEIIFDGTGPRDKTPFDNIPNLEIIFAGMSVEADTVIEEKIAASSAPKRLVVISNDRRIHAAARKRKTEHIKCEIFWAQVEKQLSRRRGPKEPHQKRRGQLSEGETDHWMQLFDLDD